MNCAGHAPTGKSEAVGYLLSAVLSAAFPGVLVYLVLWLIIPAESYSDELTDDEFYDYEDDDEDDY